MRNRMRLFAGLTPVIFLSSAAIADTLEEVEKKIVEKMNALTGFECHSISKQDMTSPARMKGEQDSTIKAMKKDGKWHTRIESKSKMTMDAGGQQQNMDGSMLMINDDKFTYMFSENNGQKSCMKSANAGSQFILDESMWKSMHENFNIKLLPDDSVDGRSCWVIEMSPKQTTPGMTNMITWYDKDHGFGIKSIGKDETGKTVMESITKDIKVNQTYPADAFVFNCPDGVQMMDMTQMGQTPAETTEAQPAADETKAEKTQEPAKEEPKKEEKKKLKLPKIP